MSIGQHFLNQKNEVAFIARDEKVEKLIKNNIKGIISISDFIIDPFSSIIFYFSKPIRLLANSCASKDCKSSIFSPTPIA